jgi:hypothetical protein
MWTFASVPLVGDWVHMPFGDSLAVYVVSAITHVPQQAEEGVQQAPLVIVTLEGAAAPPALQ